MRQKYLLNSLRRYVLLVLFLSNHSLGGVFPQPEIVWEYNCGGPLVGTPVFYPSVHEPDAVITLLQNGQIVCVSEKGEEVWRSDLGEPAQATPAVGDLDGDGIAEIVTGTVAGEVVVLEATGEERWRFPLTGRINDWISPCLPDLDNDGKREILISDDDGWMTCLSGSGKRLWRIHADPHTTSSAAIVPGPNGEPEAIVYGNENDHIVCISKTGELRWLTQEEGQYGRNNPTVGDLDGDGDYEIIVHTSFNNPNSRILALDANDGRVIWERKLNLHGYVSNTIVDLDGDGINEVVLALRSNTIYCFDGNGRERWHTITGGHAFFFTPAVADLNGDGRCEIVAGVRRSNERGKSWFVLNDRGELLGEYEMPGGANGAPLVADLDTDGRLDMVLPGSDRGLLRCITFGGSAKKARLEWVSHRYNAARLGYTPTKKKYKRDILKEYQPSNLNMEWLKEAHWGSNVLKFSQPDIKAEHVILEVSKLDPYGMRESYLYDDVYEKLPDAVKVNLSGEGKHTVKLRLWNKAYWSNPIAVWEDEVDLPPLSNFIKSLEEKLDRLSHTANQFLKTAPSLARLLQERYTLRMGSLQHLNNQVKQMDFSYAANADVFLNTLEQFNRTLEKDLALAKICQSVNKITGNKSLAVWEDSNPWDENIPILENQSISENIHIKVPLYRGEYESRALTLVNLRSEKIGVQVRAKNAVLKNIALYEVINVPRQDDIWVKDALSKMNQAQILHISPGESRQLWITINGKNLESGIQEMMLELLPIGWEDDKIRVNIVAEVLALDLQQAPPFYVCNWSSPQRLQGAGVDPGIILDAREHGANVFVFGLPGRSCNQNGELIGAADWDYFDANLKLLGDDCFILISGQGVSIPEDVRRFGPIHVKAQRAWFREVIKHLEQQGWEIDRWALYPVDEPGLFGGTLIKKFVEIAAHLKESIPELPIYANPAGFVTIENMRDMVPLVDVWAPEQALMRRQPELAPFFLNTGKKVWCYEAPPEVKTLYPLGYYRANSWMAFQLNLTGTGFWTQFYGDLWLKGVQAEYGANYIVSGQEIISRRWEAFRDGIEDVRAFAMLREGVERAKKAKLYEEQVKEAEMILTKEIKDSTRMPWKCNDITRFLRDYDMDYQEILKIRKRVAELTVLFYQL